MIFFCVNLVLPINVPIQREAYLSSRLGDLILSLLSSSRSRLGEYRRGGVLPRPGLLARGGDLALERQSEESLADGRSLR